MILSNAAIDRRITIFVLVLILVATGIYSYIVLPRESDPEIVIPYVSVATRYQGVTPEDMEWLVTIPIERKLTGISDIKEIQSTSAEGMSSIIVEFESGTDVDSALQKVRDKVDLAKGDIPQDADDPIINEVNLSELPIMHIGLTGSIGVAALNEVAEDIEDRLEAVRGVLAVEIVGGVEREIQIEVDPERVAPVSYTHLRAHET